MNMKRDSTVHCISNQGGKKGPEEIFVKLGVYQLIAATSGAITTTLPLRCTSWMFESDNMPIPP